MARLLQKDEWVAYAAFLPALLTSGGIGAGMVWRAQTPWHIPPEHAVCVAADDYVQGLAKRGIVKLPAYEVPPADELSIPAAAIAAAELRALNGC